ncbi:MAG: hypothetical protein HQ559_05165 [Lentisphaerae bacterium]|nr:hypothetical protein [Lentisphaerota bacterium]
MRLFPREAWSYAVLLVVLFCIATLAVWRTIAYLHGHIPPDHVNTVTTVMWSLTLGFMFIAGAFGLWAIRFSAEAESRRRIGRFVDAMHWLHDGLLVIDAKGRITGSNPAASTFCGREPVADEPMGELFPQLKPEDLSLLLGSSGPNEVECPLTRDGDTRIIRFRTYPSEGLSLILLSDVTTMRTRRRRSRQAARLQLIGQIARGVAHDFNDLLCGVSGHASLLTRVEPGSSEMMRSIRAIAESSERGIDLAGHLLELSRSHVGGRSTDVVEEQIRAVSEILGYTLAAGWHVEYTMKEAIPSVGLSRMQLEQVLVNVGLLAADAVGTPGTLRITVARPSGSPPLFDVGDTYAGVVLVSAGNVGSEPLTDDVSPKGPDEEGAIESVVGTILKDAGGSFDSLTAEDRAPLYRIVLPHGFVTTVRDSGPELTDELKSYIRNWSVLLAGPARELTPLAGRLAGIPTTVERADTIVSVLGRIEDETALDVMILDSRLLGHQSKALLKAILKLRPSLGVLVLCEDPASDSEGLAAEAVFESLSAGLGRLAAGLVDAKSLAGRRAQR